jgi:RHH-type proline utilization regulon transcriptional repressor/proline dehydrogenase/delta 1-pyrroline-5-carboxylate dehydrogenase
MHAQRQAVAGGIDRIEHPVEIGGLVAGGAVVGVQPFGGHGLSGTGPKAGGPHYLTRFATEPTTAPIMLRLT